MTRVVWQFDQSTGPTLYNVNEAVSHFYEKTKVKPTVIRISLIDTAKLMSTVFNQSHIHIVILEKGKRYANYINTVCGPIMLDLLEEDETISFGSSANYLSQSPQSFLVVENKEIDEQFEKHILNNGENNG